MGVNGVEVIIRSPFYEERTPASIASRTGAVVVTAAPQVGALPEANGYWEMFDVNLQRIAEALSES
jgi:hypothetical protein